MSVYKKNITTIPVGMKPEALKKEQKPNTFFSYKKVTKKIL